MALEYCKYLDPIIHDPIDDPIVPLEGTRLRHSHRYQRRIRDIGTESVTEKFE